MVGNNYWCILSLFFIFLFVMNQLGQLSPTFAQLSDQLLSGLLNFIRQLNQLDNLLVYLSYFILSIRNRIMAIGLNIWFAFTQT